MIECSYAYIVGISVFQRFNPGTALEKISEQDPFLAQLISSFLRSQLRNFLQQHS